MELPLKHTPNALGLAFNKLDNIFDIFECYVFEDNWENATEEAILPNGKTNFYVVRTTSRNYKDYDPWNENHILVGSESQLQAELKNILSNKINKIQIEIRGLETKANAFRKQLSSKAKPRKWKETQSNILHSYLKELESS
jgi:hypothetical protein